jgi:hypothetical protein
MDRRKFLKLSGAGLAGTVLLSATGARGVLAEPEAARGDSVLEREFAEAAKRFRVPEDLLVAMGLVNTALEMPQPKANEYEPGDLHGWGSYGIMQLVQNPTSNTLGEASRLTGISEERLKTDRAANIMGGAALLAESQGERPPRLGDYFGAVHGQGGRGKRYSAVAGIGSGEPFAREVFGKLKRGASVRTRAGHEIVLRPRDLAARLTEQGEAR